MEKKIIDFEYASENYSLIQVIDFLDKLDSFKTRFSVAQEKYEKNYSYISTNNPGLDIDKEIKIIRKELWSVDKNIEVLKDVMLYHEKKVLKEQSLFPDGELICLN